MISEYAISKPCVWKHTQMLVGHCCKMQSYMVANFLNMVQISFTIDHADAPPPIHGCYVHFWSGFSTLSGILQNLKFYHDISRIAEKSLSHGGAANWQLLNSGKKKERERKGKGNNFVDPKRN